MYINEIFSYLIGIFIGFPIIGAIGLVLIWGLSKILNYLNNYLERGYVDWSDKFGSNITLYTISLIFGALIVVSSFFII